jgi:hypothetical protein
MSKKACRATTVSHGSIGSRCEVDLAAHQMRFYALRRKAPTDQPLLNEVPYHREHKSFRGKPWLFGER